MAAVHAPSNADEHFAETAWSMVLAAGAATPARAKEGIGAVVQDLLAP